MTSTDALVGEFEQHPASYSAGNAHRVDGFTMRDRLLVFSLIVGDYHYATGCSVVACVVEDFRHNRVGATEFAAISLSTKGDGPEKAGGVRIVHQ